jgi:DNA-binding winged helix-turn-helix (wHTH) protein/Flp pilus assembly protein TadD
MADERFAFGAFTLDVPERRLSRPGAGSSLDDIALAPKAFDVLVCLVRKAGHLVTKRELLETVWPDTFVEEGILTVHISSLRRVLSDDIQTVPKSGYRFVAPVMSQAAAPSTTAEVYELVGRGRSHLASSSRPEIPKAVESFEAAIGLDPGYAPAHAGLALAHCAEAEFRLRPPADAFALARSSALRALARDAESADACTALGAVMFFGEWDWAGAERSLQRALEIHPGYTRARLLYGRVLEAQHRFDDALAMKLRALETDPFSPSVHLSLAQSYWNQRKFEEAIRWATKTLDIDPSHGLAREFLAGAFFALGDFDRHMAENVKHAQAHGMSAEALAPLERAYADGGRAGVVRLALQHAASHPGTMPDVQLALLHSEIGEFDEALPHLARALDAHDPCLVDLAVAPQWDALRTHPEFEACLERMRLREPKDRREPAP